MIYRLILPDWAKEQNPHLRKVIEGELSAEEIEKYNEEGYNIYFLPNYPSIYTPGVIVDGAQIDTFEYVFVDMDTKDGVWTKETFLSEIDRFPLKASRIVDSGNGIHVYWRVTDLDAMSFLRLQRRLLRYFKTDEAVGKVYQLLRVPGTVNNKKEELPLLCSLLLESESSYTCEQVDGALPPISQQDKEYCERHFNQTYRILDKNQVVDDRLPAKFEQLILNSQEAKDIWAGKMDDRSKGDYRLGHIMFASGFTKEEAASVLVNSAKALARGPQHRLNYAQNIIDKIWTFELTGNKEDVQLSFTVREILSRSPEGLAGTRFACHRYIDATEKGFRLGQVIGLVAGSGVGKTAMALNMFEGFVQNNPDYEHFFVPLEQPAREIAERWKALCGDKEWLYDKVHIMDNYAQDGTFRHLSLEEIKSYLLEFQQKNKRKIGCVVIDHIGALKKKGKNGENQDLMDICHTMKAFAVQTDTLLVMQSQAPREKAGEGDLVLNKDAAYGTVYFESYCDYLITIWQPLKKCYKEKDCPKVTAFKFCKIRHKKAHKDLIQEDTHYRLVFDPETERMHTLTQADEVAFDFFNKKCTSLRKLDRKTDLISYSSIEWTKDEKKEGEGADGKANTSQDAESA